MNKILTITLTIILAGCATREEIFQREKELLIKEGKPRSYVNGYADGCESFAYTKIQKDIKRAVADKEYDMGWNDGYSQSKLQDEKTQKKINDLQKTFKSMSEIGQR